MQGDSGGPLTVLDSGNRHTLIGLVSKRLAENHCNKVKKANIANLILNLLSQHILCTFFSPEVVHS